MPGIECSDLPKPAGGVHEPPTDVERTFECVYPGAHHVLPCVPQQSLSGLVGEPSRHADSTHVGAAVTGSSTAVVVPLRTISSLTVLVAEKKADVLRSVPAEVAEL